MKKTVLYQLNHLGYGGTEKAIFTFINNLDKECYIPKVFFYTDIGSFSYYRRKFLSLFSQRYKKSFHQKYHIYFSRREEFIKLVGENNYYQGSKKDFFAIFKKEKIDLVHFNRGGNEDFYTQSIDQIPAETKICETNIYGKDSNKTYIERLSGIFFVSKWLLEKAEWSGKYPAAVLYNPILPPLNDDTFREEMNIPDDAVVLGRIGRPNIDNGMFIWQVLQSVLRDDMYFISIGASDEFIQKTKNLKNIINLPPTTSEVEINKFYNTIDILLHYSFEGETFGMKIAEAMIHGKTVISHYSHMGNAQAELLLEEHTSGIVVGKDNVDEYIAAATTLINDTDLRMQYSQNAKIKSDRHYDERNVTQLLERYYADILK